MPKADAINFADFNKPAPTWTRDQRIEWALHTFTETAPFFWVVYRLDAANFPMKVGELQGIDFDENASAAQFGAGKFRRELRVRGNRAVGTIINEDFGIAPTMTNRAAVAGDVYTPAPPDRLSALESKLDALARGLGAVGGTSGVAVGGLSIRDAIELAKSFAPPAPAPAQNVMGMVETLFAVEKLSRRLYGSRRDDDDDGDKQGDAMGGIVRSVLETFTRSAPAAPPVPTAPPAPTPAPPAHREPFPGAATIADAVPGLVAMLPAVADREGLSADTLSALSDAIADAIEEGLGSPVKIAERFRTGGAILESLIRYRPSLAEHRGLLQIAADVFVADQLATDAEEVGGT